MNFLADECCDTALVQALRKDGHDVFYVLESLRGASDDDIPGRAFAENRLLPTEDKDFGELVYRLHNPAYGIILLRFGVAEHTLKIARLRELLNRFAERLPNAFVVLEADKTRIRPLT